MTREDAPRCGRMGCGRRLLYVLTTSGSRIAVDPAPTLYGTVVLDQAHGTVRGRVLPGTELPALTTAYTLHDVSCPALARTVKPSPYRCEACRRALPDIPGEGWHDRHATCEPAFLARLPRLQWQAIDRIRALGKDSDAA